MLPGPVCMQRPEPTIPVRCVAIHLMQHDRLHVPRYFYRLPGPLRKHLGYQVF